MAKMSKNWLKNSPACVIRLKMASFSLSISDRSKWDFLGVKNAQKSFSLHFSVFLCISLYFFAFLFISFHFSAFLCIPLHSTAFLCISLHFSAFHILVCRTIVWSVPLSYGCHSFNWSLV